ncbi:hypothetical protein ANCDUO_13728 [Ancylostoma duodenale]|uniref:G-protein coupled receptors family 1 profile domain-containing protein n=1 Tax=Ancylostoma duodenale TaxID=51022 RepID=A0A0C2GG60_9BILA|nr:hypothetical protein ANCDUO_13728 [Ancylostoma duodenale]
MCSSPLLDECGMRECECLHEPTDGVAGVVNLVMVIGILPALAILGVLLNFLNIVVFASQRNTAAKYLTALSCSDVEEKLSLMGIDLLVHSNFDGSK